MQNATFAPFVAKRQAAPSNSTKCPRCPYVAKVHVTRLCSKRPSYRTQCERLVSTPRVLESPVVVYFPKVQVMCSVRQSLVVAHVAKNQVTRKHSTRQQRPSTLRKTRSPLRVPQSHGVVLTLRKVRALLVAPWSHPTVGPQQKSFELLRGGVQYLTRNMTSKAFVLSTPPEASLP